MLAVTHKPRKPHHRRKSHLVDASSPKLKEIGFWRYHLPRGILRYFPAPHKLVLSTNAIHPTPGATAMPVAREDLRWWMLPHLMNLDAPAVAVAWQLCFAWSLGMRVYPAEAIVLFLTVWLAYAMDRVLDTWRSGSLCRTARHRFAQTHRSSFLRIAPLVLLADGLIAWLWLPEDAIRNGYPLALAAVAYALMAQRVSQFGRWFLMKEIAVGAIISWGALWTALSHGARWEQALPLLLMGTLVCAWNCVAISIWEAPLARAVDGPIRKRFLHAAHSHFGLITVCGAVTVCGLGMAMNTLHGLATGVAMAASMAFLAVLDQMNGFPAQNTRRVLADAVLLMPVLLLLLPR